MKVVSIPYNDIIEELFWGSFQTEVNFKRHFEQTILYTPYVSIHPDETL